MTGLRDHGVKKDILYISSMSYLLTFTLQSRLLYISNKEQKFDVSAVILLPSSGK